MSKKNLLVFVSFISCFFSLSLCAAAWDTIGLEFEVVDGQALRDNREVDIRGNAAILLKEPGISGSMEWETRILLNSYPQSEQNNALFRLRLQKPIQTDKIRLVSNEHFIRVVELGIYEPGMPEYPNPLSASAEGLNVPNYAVDAELTTSSFFAGFTADKVVDGKIDYLSRWVSGEEPPHYLTVDMKAKKNIGYIQMLTGHPSGNQWTHIAKEFTFQYWSQGQWKDLKGVRQQDEPGTMGLIVGYDSNGFYNLVHSSGMPNWRLQYHAKEGGVKILSSTSKNIDLMEGREYVLCASVTGSVISLCCNGELMLKSEIARPAAGKFGFWSGSAGNRITVKSIRAREINAGSYQYASDIRVSIDKAESLLGFMPRGYKHEIQLPSVETDEVFIKVERAVSGQQIFINGKKTDRVLLKDSHDSVDDVVVLVISADGSNQHRYCIEVVPVPPVEGYELAYSDEFNGESLDTDLWYCRVGKRWKSLQSRDNVDVADGNLEISLTYDKETGNHITGGVITKKMFGYGYYETRAKLWKHRGWHSAFWQMGYCPGVGFPDDYEGPANNQINEIDGFESTEGGGFSTNLQYHNPRMLFGSVGARGDVCEDFHVFGWEWTPEYVRYFYDGELVRQIRYLPPHGLQNVWLSCVAHDDAELKDIPGKIYFDYFRYYSRDYGLTQLSDDAVVMDSSDDNYFEEGKWRDGVYAISHKYDKVTRLSTEVGSKAGWKFLSSVSGCYEVFTWNPYIFTDGIVNETSYEIISGGKKSQVTINPMESGQCWVSLGKYDFEKDAMTVVRLNVNEIGPNRLCAVMLKPCNIDKDN